MSSADIAERYRIFSLQYKHFRIMAGGRPALILAVATPLTIIPLGAMVVNTLGELLLFTVILVSLALFSGLAGMWLWRDTQAA